MDDYGRVVAAAMRRQDDRNREWRRRFFEE